MSEGGKKNDQDKLPLDLIPKEALEACAAVLGFGAKKYAPYNWTKGISYSRLIAADMRHTSAFNSGEDLDPESGLSHIGHSLCCKAFLAWMIVHRPDLDDRGFKKKGPSAVEVSQALKDLKPAMTLGVYTNPLPPTAVKSDDKFIVEEGKQYLLKNGEVTDRLHLSGVDNKYPYFDSRYHRYYNEDGFCYHNTRYDIVSKYTLPGDPRITSAKLGPR